jgi:hypothetical protein
MDKQEQVTKFRVIVLGIEHDGTSRLLHGTKDNLADARIFAETQRDGLEPVCMYIHYVVVNEQGVVFDVGP